MDSVLTYMGNKREAGGLLKWAFDEATEYLGRVPDSVGEGFSGSGAATDHLMRLSPKAKWYINDCSPACVAVAKSRLAAMDPKVKQEGGGLVMRLNAEADSKQGRALPSSVAYISKYWAPASTQPKAGERVYYTTQNGRRLDVLRNGIDKAPEPIRDLLLGPLLVEASKHNNTCGNFGAFYKDRNGVGAVGGSKSQDLKRITKPITLTIPPPYPLAKNASTPDISQLDVQAWAESLPPVDFVYLDPPYNKHPYSIYYFLLDIIADWSKPEVPDTYRGQPKGWARSDFNSTVKARGAIERLVKALPAKVIAMSYHDAGLVSVKDLHDMLSKYGKVKSITADHTPYRCMQGQAGYKREGEAVKRNEQMWLLFKN